MKEKLKTSFLAGLAIATTGSLLLFAPDKEAEVVKPMNKEGIQVLFLKSNNRGEVTSTPTEYNPEQSPLFQTLTTTVYMRSGNE